MGCCGSAMVVVMVVAGAIFFPLDSVLFQWWRRFRWMALGGWAEFH